MSCTSGVCADSPKMRGNVVHRGCLFLGGYLGTDIHGRGRPTQDEKGWELPTYDNSVLNNGIRSNLQVQ